MFNSNAFDLKQLPAEQATRAEMHTAATTGDIDKVKFLIENKIIDINADLADPKEKFGINAPAIVWAAKTGHANIVQYLLEQGAKSDPSDRLYAIAIAEEHPEIVTILVKAGIKIPTKRIEEHTKRKYPISILGLALETNQLDIVKILLSQGANINEPMYDAIRLPTQAIVHTPLTFAIEKDDKKTTELLLEEGADINIKYKIGCNEYRGILYCAIKKAQTTGNTTLLELVIKTGIHIDTEALEASPGIFARIIPTTAFTRRAFALKGKESVTRGEPLTWLNQDKNSSATKPTSDTEPPHSS